ncbi:MAG: 2-phosphosulfolactate phosphatase [Planctomycetaceae bacterium]|jgi:2-phosphosulfolactate phosphatase|nr:2-phosphosulfolactate phosphatase [Planctomycetaceae bacterium]
MPDGILNVFATPEDEPLAGSAAVVIDVLRATTTISHALAAGAKCVIPCLQSEDAFQLREILRQKSPDSSILLGGERRGVLIEGFDLGNSPNSYTPETVAGKTLLFSTTNGTRAIFRALDAERIYLACFNNAAAAVRELLKYPKIEILCAGTEQKYTEEDMLLAGLLTERLTRLSNGRYALNTQAVAAKELWDTSFPLAKRIGIEPIHPENLAQILRNSRGGKNLMQIHLGKDILDASRMDLFDFVPKIERGSWEIVV